MNKSTSICSFSLFDYSHLLDRPHVRAESLEHAAHQARGIPAFGRTGNLNSLMGRKISLFARVGNYRETASNH
jgi:hypothetical protein